MKAESIGTRKYALFDDQNQQIAVISYQGWLTYEAVAELTDDEKIIFSSEGFWGQTIEAKKQDRRLATIKMDWLGNVKIYENKDNEAILSLKYVGFWQPKIILQDTKKAKVAEFVGRFKWSKFAYEYEIVPLVKDIFSDKKLLVISYFSAMYLFRFLNNSMS